MSNTPLVGIVMGSDSDWPIMRAAAASFDEFKSFAFARAISRTCAWVTLPTLSLFGTPEPFARPSARKRAVRSSIRTCSRNRPASAAARRYGRGTR